MGHYSNMPSALERAVFSGRLASQVIDHGRLGGVADLVVPLIEVSRERLLSPADRLHEIGRRCAERCCARLQLRLQQDWNLEGASGLSWSLFSRLVSQVSDLVGFGEIALQTDEASGLVHVLAWNSPFPEIMPGDEPTCVALGGFVTSFLEAVSQNSLSCAEWACRATGADICQFIAGPPSAVRRFTPPSVDKGTAARLET